MLAYLESARRKAEGEMRGKREGEEREDGRKEEIEKERQIVLLMLVSNCELCINTSSILFSEVS